LGFPTGARSRARYLDAKTRSFGLCATRVRRSRARRCESRPSCGSGRRGFPFDEFGGATISAFYRAIRCCLLFDRASAYHHRPYLHSWRRRGHCHNGQRGTFLRRAVLRWDSSDRQDISPSDWLRNSRMSHAGGAWINLGFIHPPGSRRRAIWPERFAPLPLNVDYATAHLFNLTSSLSCMVLGFVFKPNYRSVLEDTLRENTLHMLSRFLLASQSWTHAVKSRSVFQNSGTISEIAQRNGFSKMHLAYSLQISKKRCSHL